MFLTTNNFNVYVNARPTDNNVPFGYVTIDLEGAKVKTVGKTPTLLT